MRWVWLVDHVCTSPLCVWLVKKTVKIAVLLRPPEKYLLFVRFLFTSLLTFGSWQPILSETEQMGGPDGIAWTIRIDRL